MTYFLYSFTIPGNGNVISAASGHRSSHKPASRSARNGSGRGAAACVDQRIEEDVSKYGIFSHNMAFETVLSEQPWNHGTRRSTIRNAKSGRFVLLLTHTFPPIEHLNADYVTSFVIVQHDPRGRLLSCWRILPPPGRTRRTSHRPPDRNWCASSPGTPVAMNSDYNGICLLGRQTTRGYRPPNAGMAVRHASGWRGAGRRLPDQGNAASARPTRAGYS